MFHSPHLCKRGGKKVPAGRQKERKNEAQGRSFSRWKGREGPSQGGGGEGANLLSLSFSLFFLLLLSSFFSLFCFVLLLGFWIRCWTTRQPRTGGRCEPTQDDYTAGDLGFYLAPDFSSIKYRNNRENERNERKKRRRKREKKTLGDDRERGERGGGVNMCFLLVKSRLPLDRLRQP